jgi:hypothetical protein
MLGRDILKSYSTKFGPGSMDLSDEGRLAQYDREQAGRAEDASLAKRKAAMTFQGERRTADERKRLFGSRGTDMDNMADFSAEVSGLRKSPESDWWAANDQQMMAAPTAAASPGGATLMGRGDTMRSPLDSLAALASNRTPQASGGAAGSRPMQGGEVTYSPGGNYSRGPAMGELDIEALKQARAKTAAMEQGTPVEAAERERLENARKVNNPALAQLEGEYLGTRSGSQKALEAKMGAQSMMDPDVWRQKEYERTWAERVAAPKWEAASGANEARIRQSELSAWAKTQAETIKGGYSQKIAMARLLEQTVEDAGNNMTRQDQEALRALAAELKGVVSAPGGALSPGTAALVKGPQ